MGSIVSTISEKIVTCSSGVTGSNATSKNIANEVYRTHFVYNKNVRPSVIGALLAKKVKKCDSKATEKPQIKSRVVLSSVNAGCGTGFGVGSPDVNSFDKIHDSNVGNVTSSKGNDTSTPKLAAKVISSHGVNVDDALTGMIVPEKANTDSDVTARVISAPRGNVEGRAEVSKTPTEQGSGNSDKVNAIKTAPSNSQTIYDVNNQGVLDKFVNSILHANQFSGIIPDVNTEVYHKWCDQSDFNFGFVLLGDQILPDTLKVNNSKCLNPFEMHQIVKATNKPNYMEARLLVNSQLKADAWKSHLQG